uniref:Amino acid ABC transporter ATP-binding protein, PAAT family n=1 Tax=Candidatus Kentrum sp. MB TaxID=2138164 RepID=A0A450XGV8_9GAMM|nr:MAG: iron(III) transport system ATP-binding protein/polar amino acid transport system ATP-binding protein [Candidatus Kentron sp. MB]VFK28418.1 MAG: amino acid ABC transporter ATP-binding protein, PAAT family [Candidatus Kentron sp. MB]VFK74246.1 MAG: amino acid ABC transporter ATP-binding protein, PAAT family [Candidatus Kentron sp. MB]
MTLTRETALLAEGLCVRFAEKTILRDVSFELQSGKTLGILGVSGAGKTTLLKAVSGLILATRGRVVLGRVEIIREGRVTRNIGAFRKNLVLVPQSPSLLPHLTVKENVSTPLRRVRRLDEKSSRADADEVLAELGIDRLGTRYPEELSSGELQRVQLARAMALKPGVLLLDEITANIDNDTKKYVLEALWKVRRDRKGDQASMLVTHDLEFAEAYCDEVIHLADGVLEKT